MRSRPRWPPSPSVEDELESLSRELDGLSKLGENLDAEDVMFKGTVNQYPILIPLDMSSSSLSTSSIEPSRRPTLAERLEEKLRCRRALRELQALEQDEQGRLAAAAESLAATSSDTLMVGPARPTGLPRMSLNIGPPKSAPQSPTVRPCHGMETGDGAASRSTGHSTPLVRMTSQYPPQRNGQSPVHPSNKVQGISTQIDAKRTVTFTDQQFQKPILLSQPHPQHHTPYPCESSLPSYPLSNPTPIQNSWSTIQGLFHLAICPQCTTKISASKFYPYLIPIPIPTFQGPNQKPRCSFNNPWTRLAWIQTITQNYDHLGLLYQITLPQPSLPPALSG